MVNKMITLYNTRRSKSNDSNNSDDERLIPAGAPYLTKRNGKLFLTRSKHPKRAELASDLLREAFAGKKLTVVRKRANSVQRRPEKTTFLIGGEAYVPPPLQSQRTAPLPQQIFGSSASSPELQFVASPLPSPTQSQEQPQFSVPLPQQPFVPPIPSQIQGFLPHPPQAQMTSLMPSMPYPPVLPQYAHYYPPHPQRPMPGYNVFDPNQDTIRNSNKYQNPGVDATQEDLNRLKVVDAHFRKVNMDQSKTKPEDVGKAKEEPPKGATIERHVCANCGRLRSKKYHKKNPIKPGEKPLPDFCRNCQKDDSSNSESETGNETPKPKKKTVEKNRKDGNSRNKSKQPTVESSSEPEITVIPKSKARAKSKESHRVRNSKEDIITVEVELSEDDQSHRGRSHKRQHGQRQNSVEKKSEVYSPQQSPVLRPLNRARSISRDTHSRYEASDHQPLPQRRRQPRPDSTHSRQSSFSYRYVPAPIGQEPEKTKESYRKQIPVTFIGGKESEKSASRSRSPEKSYGAPQLHKAHREDGRRDSQPNMSNMAEDEYRQSSESWNAHKAAYSRRSPVQKENSWDGSVDSARSYGAATPRQPSRWANPSSSTQPWQEIHIINPGLDDEVVVFTETFDYRRPKTVSTTDDEKRRRQEDLDREMLNFKLKTPHLPAEDRASKYYTDDWVKEEELARRRQEAEVRYGEDWWREISPEGEHVPGEWPNAGRWDDGQKKEPGSWRREAYQDPDLDGWSDTESYLNAVKEQRLTRRSPPNYFQPPQPTDSHSEPSTSFRRSRWANVRDRGPSSEETVRRPSRESRPRPVDSRNYKSPRASSSTSLIPSPHVTFGEQVQYFEGRARSYSRSTDYEVEEAPSEFSGMTEAERELLRRVERVTRRVIFGERDASRSVNTAAAGGTGSGSGSARNGHSTGRSQRSDERSFDSQYYSTSGSEMASDIRERGSGDGLEGTEGWENGGNDRGSSASGW